jgi:3-phenylpropionate/trans-cinnamate dioxygenase ferredoxin subunit
MAAKLKESPEFVEPGPATSAHREMCLTSKGWPESARLEFGSQEAGKRKTSSPARERSPAQFLFSPEVQTCLMADVTIEVIKNGPYIVKGEVELKDADGKSLPVEKRMALCRCGASSEKPFCDGTHSKIGFQAAAQAVPESAED